MADVVDLGAEEAVIVEDEEASPEGAVEVSSISPQSASFQAIDWRFVLFLFGDI